MLTLHVLSCGHGDTLLLEMPGKKWALIDCHLPGKDAIESFLALLESFGIKTLDYVVLTHPDSDHYQGMADVLEHFSKDGRSVQYYCDAGGSHEHVIKLLESRGTPSDDVGEYVRLIKTVDRLQDEKKLDRHWLNNHAATIQVPGHERSFSLVAIGPAQAVIARAQDSALLGEGGLPDINELSVVLVAQLVKRFVQCRMLLPGDVEGDGMVRALERWDRHRDNINGVKTFDVIKAPHHGSENGHDLRLADRIRRRNRGLLAISCGKSYDLPSKTVISDYLDRGWRVYCTEPRHAPPRRRSAFESMHPSIRTGPPRVRHDILISATPVFGIRAQPAAAEIKRTHLAAYI